jgi:symplekin
MQLADFKLPPPREHTEDDRIQLMQNSASRLWSSAVDLTTGDLALDSSHSSNSPTELSMLLLIRMVTRIVDPSSLKADETGHITADVAIYARQDHLRQTLVEYIMSDFSSRCGIIPE